MYLYSLAECKYLIAHLAILFPSFSLFAFSRSLGSRTSSILSPLVLSTCNALSLIQFRTSLSRQRVIVGKEFFGMRLYISLCILSNVIVESAFSFLLLT